MKGDISFYRLSKTPLNDCDGSLVSEFGDTGYPLPRLTFIAVFASLLAAPGD